MALKTTDIAKQVTEMVVNAIYQLQEGEGSSLKHIMSFIENNYDVNEEEIVRPVAVALKRGVEFGFLKKINGNYRIDIDGSEDGSRYEKEHKRRRLSKKGEKSDKRSKSKGGKKR